MIIFVLSGNYYKVLFVSFPRPVAKSRLPVWFQQEKGVSRCRVCFFYTAYFLNTENSEGIKSEIGIKHCGVNPGWTTCDHQSQDDAPVTRLQVLQELAPKPTISTNPLKMFLDPWID